ncbi:hypothetical protein MMC09_006129 [Bachmanniomyces sp. S44760]|nr:hypothetical protein [Bachmanniomyces sp. S44760]
MYPKYQDISGSSPTSSTSSSSSLNSPAILLTPSPRTSAFANPICIPAKSLPSQASTTSADSILSLDPRNIPCASPGSPNNSCAYPSWPNRSLLSPTRGGSNKYSEVSSYISDEDLADFAGLSMCDSEDLSKLSLDYEEHAQCISWSQVGQPPVTLAGLPQVEMVRQPRESRRLAPAPERRRRRSSPLKRRGTAPPKVMSTITE